MTDAATLRAIEEFKASSVVLGSYKKIKHAIATLTEIFDTARRSFENLPYVKTFISFLEKFSFAALRRRLANALRDSEYINAHVITEVNFMNFSKDKFMQIINFTAINRRYQETMDSMTNFVDEIIISLGKFELSIEARVQSVVDWTESWFQWN